MTNQNAYANAGVDVAAGEQAVDLMGQAVSATYTPQVLGGIGGFGAAFALGKSYRDPVLISGTDGVGTKLLLAIAADKHDTIGQDLVAMVMNDILAQGAKPLFLLDYLAIAKMTPEKVATIVTGIAKATQAVGAALIGGESAELPGMYAPNHYDLAAFGVGVVERDEMLNPTDVAAGDVLIGLPSSGIHSNGYTLVREVFGIHQEADFLNLPTRLQDALLKPTVLYAPAVLPLLAQKLVVSMAHITGGGIVGNLPRAYNDHVTASLRWGSWPILPIFTEIQTRGELTATDMLETFNLGLGMILIVKPDQVDVAMTMLQDANHPAFIIGEMVPRKSQPIIWQGARPW
ncbi:phosphoribosylformylglycinamidine cyclo-ligase [Weissella confusa]|uniref:Phosphoribosylformylglycinamidine cyclo-ligase n=1 Tax=Weissella fermenti TaxID=2987699 RepID=A0ABT6D937_9LACO|nr:MULTISPECIES: phosphoribosylformylglycinamidine cyclo-ligase [Weissella]MBJ7688109.1 phosphoribosylformylglycinamidine cyclo-ligase [Weissella confusa]MCW0926234.1 phosphoribosylformylglycinamidine cyclo-ligase [Weissella sp. LMG 11983]MDF9300212.1 phosphoribosylformylglycinamidine cyclo-ligase [Weissella sp. BK2]